MKYLPVIDLIEKHISGEWGNEASEGPLIKVIRNTNFTNEGKLNLEDVVERSIPKNKIIAKLLKYGDIIIEKSGGSPSQPVGRVVFYDQKDGEYLFSNFTSALRPKRDVFSRYLFYSLYAHHFFKTTLSFQNKTTGILNLQLTRYLKETKIPLPPLETQKKIASILDKADELRQNDRKILSKYDQLAQSLFLKMFGDPVRNPKNWNGHKLKDVCSKITDGTHNSPAMSDKGYPYVTAKHVRPFNLDFKRDPTYVSKKQHDVIYKRCNPEKGDVLLIKDGATTGIACINKFDEEISLLSSLALLKPKKNLLSNQYLCYWLNDENLKSKTLKEYMAGVAIKRYTLKKINEFDINIPPIELQNRFTLIIEQIETQKQLTQQSLQKSEELFQSLLQRAFKGEIS